LGDVKVLKNALKAIDDIESEMAVTSIEIPKILEWL
jgi:hypothetical protein